MDISSARINGYDSVIIFKIAVLNGPVIKIEMDASVSPMNGILPVSVDAILQKVFRYLQAHFQCLID